MKQMEKSLKKEERRSGGNDASGVSNRQQQFRGVARKKPSVSKNKKHSTCEVHGGEEEASFITHRKPDKQKEFRGVAQKKLSASKQKKKASLLKRKRKTGINYDQGEQLFFAAYFLYLLRSLLANSTIQAYIPVGGYVLNMVRISMFIIIFVKCCWFDRVYRPIVLLKYLFMFCVLSFSVFNNGYKYLLDVGILLLGAQHVPLKKIVRFFFITAGSATAVFFVLSVSGIIENYYYDSIYVDRGARYAFGTLYATDFAAMMFYLIMSKYYIRRDKAGFLDLVICFGIGAFIIVFCDARMNSALIVAFAVVTFIADRWPFIWKNPVSKWVFRWSMPLCCTFILFLQAMYIMENAYVVRLDELLSKRLGNGCRMLEEYGVSLFGENIVLRGNGWATANKDLTLEYNYIDCGYLQILLRYGVIILVLFVAAHYFAVKYDQQKARHYKLQIIVFFIAVSSILEPRLIQIVYNPFIFIIVTVLERKLKSGISGYGQKGS